MAYVRTGKANLGNLADILCNHEWEHDYGNDDRCDIFPREWMDRFVMEEEIAIEIVEDKSIVLTRKTGEVLKLELEDTDYIGDALWGELLDERVMLFSDNDLDGYGCGVVGTIFFGKLNIDIEHMRYNRLFDRLKEFFTDEVQNYGKVFLTDLNINEEQYIELTLLAPNFNFDENFNMIDHHVTSLPMNVYPFATVVDVREDGFKPCGTSLFYDYCKAEMNHPLGGDGYNLEEFVELVRQWDVFDFKNTGNPQPPKLNKLSFLYSAEEFVEMMVDRVNEWRGQLITDNEEFYLEMKQREMESHFRAKEKTIAPVDFEGHKIGLVFGALFPSELGNHLSETFPEYDAIMMISMGGGVSLRTTHDHVDCSKLAKSLGGGGHPKASGFPMENIKDWVAQYVEDKNWND